MYYGASSIPWSAMWALFRVLDLFYGADVPYIIRPSNEVKFYQLIGESYIHGIMNGEALGFGIQEEYIKLT